MALTAKKVYAILKHQISDMEAKLNSPITYKGTVASADLLPLNPSIGDMYNIESESIYGEAGTNVAWNGSKWRTIGSPIKIPSKTSELQNDSKFVTETDLQNALGKKANGEGITLSINENGGLRVTYNNGK